MYTKFLHPEELNEFFLDNPHLASKCLSDHILSEFKDTGKYRPHAGSLYLGAYEDDELVGVLRFENYINYPPTATMHQYIAEKHRDLKKSLPNFFVRMMREMTHYQVLLTIVPQDATHVHKYCKYMEYEEVGHIKQHMMWRGKLNDVTIYKIDLKE